MCAYIRTQTSAHVSDTYRVVGLCFISSKVGTDQRQHVAQLTSHAYESTAASDGRLLSKVERNSASPCLFLQTGTVFASAYDKHVRGSDQVHLHC